MFDVIIYDATRPVHDRVKRRVRPRSLVFALSLVLVALPVLTLFTYTIAIGFQELTRFSERYDVGRLEEAIAQYLDVSTIPLTVTSSPATR